MHATRAKVAPLQEVAYSVPCCNYNNGCGNSSKFRAVKSFVAATALESFAEIQINKMPYENCSQLQVASNQGGMCGWIPKVFYGYWTLSSNTRTTVV